MLSSLTAGIMGGGEDQYNSVTPPVNMPARGTSQLKVSTKSVKPPSNGGQTPNIEEQDYPPRVAGKLSLLSSTDRPKKAVPVAPYNMKQ